MNHADISPVDADLRRHLAALDRQDVAEERIGAVSASILANLCSLRPDDTSCEFAAYALQDGENEAQLLAVLFRNDPRELQQFRERYWDMAMEWADERAREYVK